MAGIPHRDADAPIRATDSDAAQARLSAVRKGYLNDPFINYFIQKPHLVPNRPPLINIGTYVRSEGIDALITKFFSLFEDKVSVQIVSLGAGSDTRFWRLSAGPNNNRIVKYVEIDFAEVTARKLALIRKSTELRTVIGDITSENGGTGCSSKVYHLLPADLREDPESSLLPLINILDYQTPTLVLAECVFAYMETSLSEKVLQWFTNRFTTVGCLIYEMFALNDSFGQVMKENLRARNVSLPGVERFVDLQSLRNRFNDCGFSDTNGITLKLLWSELIPKSEVNRIATLEHVDEWEEILLVLNHYAISWGSKLIGSSDKLNHCWELY
ncbi:carboxy methyl transferase for protein phosphatase 2A [Tulasnella sp. 418]|nr:carboxy methyl transferase for protein phosphatase 2A [Tulasnella sp. 418]